MDEERDNELNGTYISEKKTLEQNKKKQIKENFTAFGDLFQSDEDNRNEEWENMVWHDSEARNREFERDVDKGFTDFGNQTDKGFTDFGNQTDKGFTDFGNEIGGYYNRQKTFKADRVRYKERPHIRNASEAKRRKYLKTKKITYGTGPIGMLALYLLDYIVDFLYFIGLKFVDLFSFGFEFINEIFFGGFKGIFPGLYDQLIDEYEGERRVSKFAGTCISYKGLRYFLTLVSPPVGVFLGKGIKGFMTIIICTILTYIHFVLGVIYAFVVTSRCRYADYYEKREGQVFEKIQKEIDKKTPEMEFGKVIGIAGIFLCFFLIIYFMVKNS